MHVEGIKDSEEEASVTSAELIPPHDQTVGGVENWNPDASSSQGSRVALSGRSILNFVTWASTA